MGDLSLTGLSQDRLKELLVYSPETGNFFWNNPIHGRVILGEVAGSLSNDGYIRIKVNNTNYLAHRLAWLYVHGYWPSMIDHINRCRDDNRLVNLREVTTVQNIINSDVAINNMLGVKGVRRWGNKYMARITFNRRCIYLGLFTTIEEAVYARVSKFKELYGGQAFGDFADD